MKKNIYSIILLSSLLISSCVSTHPDLNDGLYADIQTNKGDILINLTFKETKSNNSVAFQNVLIEDLSGDLHLLRYRLILLKGNWKIAGVEFLRTEIMAI